MAKHSLIAVVEDDQPFRESMRKLMTSLGYTVEAFPLGCRFPGIASPRYNCVLGQPERCTTTLCFMNRAVTELLGC